MLSIRAYKVSDAIKILSGLPRQPGLDLDDLTLRWAKDKEAKGPAVTGVVGDRIVGCGGLEILWPGMAEGWCLFVDDIERHTMSVAKAVKSILRSWIDDYKLVRVQAPMRVDFPAGLRFVEWLGFTREAVLRKYHPGGVDAVMYSIVR